LKFDYENFKTRDSRQPEWTPDECIPYSDVIIYGKSVGNSNDDKCGRIYLWNRFLNCYILVNLDNINCD
jgi:hypothetical protein